MAPPNTASNIFAPTEPLIWAILTCTGVSLTAFVRSTMTGNCSFVDRMWSIIPIIYSAIFFVFSVAHTGRLDPRCTIGFVLVLLWGIRLTANFARKDGYSAGAEDYRWPYLRKNVIRHPVLWVIFNLVFISVYQNVLLLLIVMPLWVAYLDSVGGHQVAWGYWESIAMGSFLVFLAGETVADNQQFAFQTRKYELLAKLAEDDMGKKGEQNSSGSDDGEEAAQMALLRRHKRLPMPYRYGFITTGLFACSRHPNFFCEFMQWWSLYMLCVRVAASSPAAMMVAGPMGVWLNWGLPGAVLLTLLFLGSTAFTEHISAGKYPLYKAYQARTSMLVPWVAGRADLEDDGRQKKA